MSENKLGRGRPKGSGLNDSAQLAAIQKLLAADPALKPTTAIKKVGVTDPSAVRRLRDKLNASRAEAGDTNTRSIPPDVIATEVALQSGKTHSRPAVQPCAMPASPAIKAKTTKAKAAPAAVSDPVRPEPASSPKQATELATAVAAANDTAPSPDWLAYLGSIGLTAFAASFEFQLAFFGQALRLPPVSVALKQQLLLNEMTLAFCLPASESTRTLH